MEKQGFLKSRLERFNQLSDYDRNVVVPSFSVAFCFLFIHIVMFLFFLFYRVTPMAVFNCFSVLFYLVCILVIRKNWIFQFVLMTYIEVLLHMFLAIVFVGWESGFQTTLIGIMVMIFYSEYVGKSMGIRYVPGVGMSALTMSCYILAYVISEVRPAPYRLPHPVEYTLTILWAVTTFVIAILFLQIFVNLTVRSEAQLREERSHDALTGLFNRYFMIGHLNKLMSRSREKKCWLAIADVDDFKQVNDTYGHNCGDYVLRTLAELFRSNLTDAEVCRWGGEEFLMAGTAERTGKEEKERLEELCRTISDYAFNYEGQPLHITVTIGFALYENETRQETWISRADTALYKGKSSGKNRVCG